MYAATDGPLQYEPMMVLEKGRRRKPDVSTQQNRGFGALALLITAGVALLVIVFGLMALHVVNGGSGSSDANVNAQPTAESEALPEFILALGERTAAAYRFALDRPDIMLWMPCYCGCGGHEGHKSARDCFVDPSSASGDVKFDEHGSDCTVCVDIALRAQELTLAGSSVSETRSAVDQEFDIGGTDTPLPPG
jgi:hypothetical protein